MFKNIKLFYVYLAGAMEADTIDGGQAWRDEVTSNIGDMSICIQDPCRSEPLATGMGVVEAQAKFNKWIQGGCIDLFVKKFRVIFKKDIRMVKRSDFLIVQLFQKIHTTGTISEMHEAHSLKKPIYMIWKGPKSKMSKWAIYLVKDSGGQIFYDVKSCCEFIEEEYDLDNVNGVVKIIQFLKSIYRNIEQTVYNKFYLSRLKKKAETKTEKNKRLKK